MAQKSNISVTRTSLPPFEEYCEAIRPLWDSHILTNMGPLHEQLREDLAARLGCRVTLFSHGHLALEAAIKALFPAKGEVITTPFTFVSTVHAIVRCGLKPVFCDVLPEDGTLDPAGLEDLIGPNTVGILPVHVYGHPCDVEGIGAIARKHNLPVLYDAAHAFGVSYKGRPLVQAGRAAILSFHATKVFSTIEGGAVCYNGPESLAQRLDDEKNFGIRDEKTCVSAGGNAKLNELEAAMGLCNLRHFEEERAAREMAYKHYLAHLPVGSLLSPRPGTEPNYAYLPLLLPDYQTRERACEALRAEGIRPRRYFWPLVTETDCYRGKFDADTSVARDLAERVLCLPLYAGLLPEEIDRICGILARL